MFGQSEILKKRSIICKMHNLTAMVAMIKTMEMVVKVVYNYDGDEMMKPNRL